MHEPGTIEAQPPGRILPPDVEREPVRRLPVRAPLDPLQHHHHRHDHRRHRPAAGLINKSANISSGNNAKHSWCKIPWIEPGATRPSQQAAVEENRSVCLGVRPSVIAHPRRRKSCNYRNSPEMTSEPV